MPDGVGFGGSQPTTDMPVLNRQLKKYTLEWDQTTQWASFPEIGSIYTQKVRIISLDNYIFDVSFFVGDGRTLGCLFCEVLVRNERWEETPRHYFFGHFRKNDGAMKFAQFALNNFIETETWHVCPSFEPIDWIGGEAYTLSGDEIVSEYED